MSRNYSYERSPDDFKSRQDVYLDSESVYLRDHAVYRPRARSSRSEPSRFSSSSTTSSSRASDTSGFEPVNVQSLLSSCGLDTTDLSLLAELPEHLITVETLPHLLSKIKETKSTRASSSRSPKSELYPDHPKHDWEVRNRTQVVEYPLHRSARPTYPLPREQVADWQDRWGNPRKTSTTTDLCLSTDSTYTGSYDRVRLEDASYSGLTQTSESREFRTTTASQSRADYTSRNVDPSRQRKRDTHPKVPTRKEASDFLGRVPPVFPYACVLCDITVLSEKDWSVHISGAQHANSQLTVLQRYPEWDQQLASARRNEPQAERPREGDRSSRSLPKSSQNKGDPSNTRNRRDTKKETEKKKGSGKVVIVKFAVNSIDETYLKNLLGQFGAIIKVMMLRTLAFVEMGSKDQSEDIVKYFSSNPLKVKGNPVEFSVSTSMNLLQGSRVVSFYPLPSGDGISSEIMGVAKRFGPVKNSFFLPSRGFVEMTASEDAEKLVEHYAVSPLKLQGKTIKIAFSTEYEKLADVKEEDRSSLRSGALPRSSNRRSRSPTKRQQSPRKHSPAPKRRCSETRRSKEKTRSSRSLSSKERDAGHGSRQSSKERPSSSSSSQTESKTAESDKDLEERVATPPNNVADDNKEDEGPEVTDMDSDLEGMEVIADDGVELREEDEPVEGPRTEEQVRESKCGEASNEDELRQKRTVGRSLSDERETPHSQTEEKPQDSADGLTEGCDKGPSAPAVETKSFAKSAQETENKEREQKGQVQEVDEEESDFLQCLENCITLDELEEVPDSDADSEKRLQRQSSNEQNVKEVKNTNQDHAAGITAEKQSVDKAPTDSKQVKPMKTCHRPEEKEKQSNSTPTSKTEAQDCNTGKESGSNCHTATANGNVKRTLDASDGKPAPKKEPVDSALEPYNPNNPVGREFVRPVVGYFCNLCNVIYASEEEAKEEHCSTLSHYQKLKEHMDKRNGST